MNRFIQRRRKAEEQRDAEITLEERLEDIRRKAEEGYVGPSSAHPFDSDNPFPKCEGIEVEEIEGDPEELTASWMLGRTNWKVIEENGSNTEDSDLTSYEEAGIQVEEINGDEIDWSEATADMLLRNTPEWKLEGMEKKDTGAQVTKPRDGEKIPDRWKDIRRNSF